MGTSFKITPHDRARAAQRIIQDNWERAQQTDNTVLLAELLRNAQTALGTIGMSYAFKAHYDAKRNGGDVVLAVCELASVAQRQHDAAALVLRIAERLSAFTPCV